MRIRSSKYAAPLGLLIAVCFFCEAMGVDRNSANGIEYYEKEVRPLLAERCYKCHALNSKRVGGGLLLDNPSDWQRGGDSGPVLVPGKPNASLLIKAVRYADSDLQMPPKNKLTDAEIRVLEQWISIGAPATKQVRGKPLPTPQPIDMELGRRHWAYRAIGNPQPPTVRNTRWPKSPIDQFVLARLEGKAIQPAKPADKRTLIRRATFDLTGLPPTPKEIDAFVADKSPDAFAKLIDGLLASPRYGERWGRHWLDVARYADSNGLDENIAHGNAWRYRDYVISAFNNDKPFDQFVMEQLAGDLLPDDGSNDQTKRHERLIATGFLSLGPKVLAEVDESKMEMDIVDEQLDTVGKTFLATTLGCARCHDHKFDPFTIRDYYALAGVFKSTRTMEHFKKIAKWWENPIPTDDDRARRNAYDQQLHQLKSDIQELIKRANAEIIYKQGATGELPDKPEAQYSDDIKAKLKSLREALAKSEKSPVTVSSAISVTEGKIVNVPIHLRGSHLKLGDVVPRGFPQVLAGDNQRPIPKNASGRLEFAKWLVAKKNPLAARVMVNRIWRWHFGEGLVRTPDNFGRLGEAPTHPILLDWLAKRFVDEGWSVKSLHRTIMLSSTYRMSSTFDANAAAVNPTNRLMWRASVRRLEAEAVRDAILAVSGRLDLKMGGPVLHVKNREFIFNHTSKDETKYASTRRSVYLPVIRNHLYDVLALYDFPDSAVVQGNRPTTTVAPQAMLAMNGPLIWESAGALAQSVLSQDTGDTERIKRLYQRLLGRHPRASETRQVAQFIRRFSDQSADDPTDRAIKMKLAWQTLCQTMLASSEFIYIR